MNLLKILKKKTILTKSEKPAGRWSNNSKLYNFFITSKIFYNINIYFYLRNFLYKIKQTLYDNK